jgi:hypothetical protein
MILFPDTHFFLHYRHADELPWQEVSSASQITLMVGRTVPKELDNAKFKLTGRARRLARVYVGRLQNVAATGNPYTLRKANPRVLLDFAPPRPVGWSMPRSLDPSSPDHQLIADALAYVADNSNVDVMVVTSDPGLVICAKTHGLRFFPLPQTKNWERPPQPSPHEKEIAELKRKGPSITCELFKGCCELDDVRLEAQRFPPLSANDVEQLVDQVRAAHPEATCFDKDTVDSLFSRITSSAVIGQTCRTLPTQDEIEQYRQQ